MLIRVAHLKLHFEFRNDKFFIPKLRVEHILSTVPHVTHRFNALSQVEDVSDFMEEILIVERFHGKCVESHFIRVALKDHFSVVELRDFGVRVLF